MSKKKEKFLKLWKLIIAEISLDIRCYVKYFNVKLQKKKKEFNWQYFEVENYTLSVYEITSLL